MALQCHCPCLLVSALLAALALWGTGGMLVAVFPRHATLLQLHATALLTFSTQESNAVQRQSFHLGGQQQQQHIQHQNSALRAEQQALHFVAAAVRKVNVKYLSSPPEEMLDVTRGAAQHPSHQPSPAEATQILTVTRRHDQGSVKLAGEVQQRWGVEPQDGVLDRPDLCAELLGIKKLAIMFLTRGALHHEPSWQIWCVLVVKSKIPSTLPCDELCFSGMASFQCFLACCAFLILLWAAIVKP